MGCWSALEKATLALASKAKQRVVPRCVAASRLGRALLAMAAAPVRAMQTLAEQEILTSQVAREKRRLESRRGLALQPLQAWRLVRQAQGFAAQAARLLAP